VVVALAAFFKEGGFLSFAARSANVSYA